MSIFSNIYLSESISIEHKCLFSVQGQIIFQSSAPITEACISQQLNQVHLIILARILYIDFIINGMKRNFLLNWSHISLRKRCGGSLWFDFDFNNFTLLHSKAPQSHPKPSPRSCIVEDHLASISKSARSPTSGGNGSVRSPKLQHNWIQSWRRPPLADE